MEHGQNTDQDDCLREKLAEADADIDAGDVALWDAKVIKQRDQARLARLSGT